MPWLYLVFGGIFEVGFTTAMKASDGFTRVIPSLAFLVCAALSFWFLSRATLHLPIGTAYAVWTGIGAVGTVIMGIVLYGEPAGAMRLFFIATLVGSIIGLKFVS
ncbi:DMT family transporter [Paracoccaceae bacterium GXU_MW_L88]